MVTNWISHWVTRASTVGGYAPAHSGKGVVAVEHKWRPVAAPLVLNPNDRRIAELLDAGQDRPIALYLLRAKERARDQLVASGRVAVEAREVALRVLPVDEPPGTQDLHRVIVDVNHDEVPLRPVYMAVGIQESLAHSLARNLGNLVARARPLDHDAPPRVVEDVEVRLVDEVKHCA